MYCLKSYIKPTLIALTVIAILYALARVTTVELKAVQSGKSELWCHLHTGWKLIDPEKVVGLHSNGKWLFKNGSARACEVVKVND